MRLGHLRPENDTAKSMSSPNTIILPAVSIQPSFPEVIQEVQDGVIPFDKFWVSCYKNSETSIHAKVFVELDDVDRNLVLLKPVKDSGEKDDNIQIGEIGGVSVNLSEWHRFSYFYKGKNNRLCFIGSYSYQSVTLKTRISRQGEIEYQQSSYNHAYPLCTQ